MCYTWSPRYSFYGASFLFHFLSHLSVASICFYPQAQLNYRFHSGWANCSIPEDVKHSTRLFMDVSSLSNRLNLSRIEFPYHLQVRMHFLPDNVSSFCCIPNSIMRVIDSQIVIFICPYCLMDFDGEPILDYVWMNTFQYLDIVVLDTSPITKILRFQFRCVHGACDCFQLCSRLY